MLHRCHVKKHWCCLRLHRKAGWCCDWWRWWCPWRHFNFSGGDGSHAGHTVKADLESPQTKDYGTKVKLWTDSQSTLQSVFSLKPTSKLVQETIKLLVFVKLIPSHPDCAPSAFKLRPKYWCKFDAHLLRKHSVRWYCAYIQFLPIYANWTHANNTFVEITQKIKQGMREKKEKNPEPGFKPRISNLEFATLTTQPPRFSCTGCTKMSANHLRSPPMFHVCYIHLISCFKEPQMSWLSGGKRNSENSQKITKL